jgi:hypothetical protein
LGIVKLSAPPLPPISIPISQGTEGSQIQTLNVPRFPESLYYENSIWKNQKSLSLSKSFFNQNPIELCKIFRRQFVFRYFLVLKPHGCFRQIYYYVLWRAS